jgi:dTDP-4-amino-4,6-dideoxygalactose transaminase
VNPDVTDQIALARPTFGPEEVEAVKSVLESGWVAGQGPRGAALEEAFRALCDAEYAVAVANCTAALHLALLAQGIGPGDEVLVADYTYPATGHSVLFCGATPVFVDVRRDTGTIDVDAAAAAVTDRTVGVIAVDVFGQAADYDELVALASGRGLFVVEDAAAGIGATYRGRPTGVLADIGTFSLHARKGITSGEGGVLTTNDPAIAADARKRHAFGVESAFVRDGEARLAVPVFTALGYNYKLSEIQAAVALVQLERLAGFLATRRSIADTYQSMLQDVAGVTPPVALDDRDHTWQAYVVTLDPDIDRDRVATDMRARGVQATIGTFASHLQPVYESKQRCPISADLFGRHLAIPMHAAMTEGTAERVVHALKDAIEVKEPA